MAIYWRKTLFWLATLILILGTMVCETTNGELFALGWSDGEPAYLHYDTWGPSNNFHICVTIELYCDSDYDNVVQVTREDFETCNYARPIAIWSDTYKEYKIHITEYGHFYFISGKPGHCEHGQKVIVYVPEPSSDGPLRVPNANTANELAPSSNYSSTYAPAPNPLIFYHWPIFFEFYFSKIWILVHSIKLILF